MTKYICGCGEEVGACGIMGTNETYPEEECGHCGVPLCTDCYDDSGWTCDGDQCCAPCCAEMKAGADEQKGECGIMPLAALFGIFIGLGIFPAFIYDVRLGFTLLGLFAALIIGVVLYALSKEKRREE